MRAVGNRSAASETARAIVEETEAGRTWVASFYPGCATCLKHSALAEHGSCLCGVRLPCLHEACYISAAGFRLGSLLRRREELAHVRGLGGAIDGAQVELLERLVE